MSRRGGRVLLCHRHAKPCSIMTDVVVPKRATSLPGRMPTAGAGVFLQTILIWKQTLTSWYVHKTQTCGNRGGRGGLTLRAFIGLLLVYGCGCGCSCGAVTGEHSTQTILYQTILPYSYHFPQSGPTSTRLYLPALIQLTLQLYLAHSVTLLLR